MDIRFKNGTTSFSLRSAGILIKNGCILLQRERNGQDYALPGGTVQYGETTEEAILREWQEETGVSVHIKKLLWIEEGFWHWKGMHHSITLYYLLDCVQSITTGNQLDNPNILLE